MKQGRSRGNATPGTRPPLSLLFSRAPSSAFKLLRPPVETATPNAGSNTRKCASFNAFPVQAKGELELSCHAPPILQASRHATLEPATDRPLQPRRQTVRPLPFPIADRRRRDAGHRHRPRQEGNGSEAKEKEADKGRRDCQTLAISFRPRGREQTAKALQVQLGTVKDLGDKNSKEAPAWATKHRNRHRH